MAAMSVLACRHDDDVTSTALAAVLGHTVKPVPNATTATCPSGSILTGKPHCYASDEERRERQQDVALLLASVSDDFAEFAGENRVEISKLLATAPSAIDALTEPIARKYSCDSELVASAMQNALVRGLGDGIVAKSNASSGASRELDTATFKTLLPSINDDALLTCYANLIDISLARKDFNHALDYAEKSR
jgi:hypothetical protein